MEINIIRQIRIENNLTQSALANIISSSHICRGKIVDTVISRWELGQVIPGKQVCDFLEQKFNKSEVRLALQNYKKKEVNKI